MSTISFKQKREIIDSKVKEINEMLGENYKVSYNSRFGGFKLYKTKEGSTAEYSGKLGTWRMNADTFIEYLNGIMNCLSYFPF